MIINRKKGLITSLVIFIPMFVGLFLWKQLPDELPTRFNLKGEPDGYSSKQFVVFAMPFIFFVLHWFTLLMTSLDPKKDNISPKMMNLLYLIIPVMTTVVSITTYGYALHWVFDPSRLVMGLLAIIFIMIGNYLPKLKQNYTVGIKLPWTLDNEDNWIKTHRLAGRLWLIGGLLMLLGVLVAPQWLLYFLSLILVLTLIPIIYSYYLYRKANHK